MLYNINKNKAYIGQTLNFHKRATSHHSNLNTNRHPCKDLQKDYNNGCKFLFVILEDMGKCSDRDEMLLKEKQYIFAFRNKSIKTYNAETNNQLYSYLFYYIVFPSIKNIQNDFRKKFGCQMPSIEYCSEKTLREKFREKA